MPDIIYVWDPIEDNVIRERDEDGNTIVNYTTEPTLYGQVLSQDRGGQVRHYHYDGQGNTVSLTDASGNVTDTRKYSAFGEVTESTGTTEFPLQYGGRSGYARSDGPIDYYIRRRWYSAQNCRWISVDPIPDFTLGPYAFVMNRPLQIADPSGESCQVWYDCKLLRTSTKGAIKYCDYACVEDKSRPRVTRSGMVDCTDPRIPESFVWQTWTIRLCGSCPDEDWTTKLWDDWAEFKNCSRAKCIKEFEDAAKEGKKTCKVFDLVLPKKKLCEKFWDAWLTGMLAICGFCQDP